MKFKEKMKHSVSHLFYGLLIVSAVGCKDDDPVPAAPTIEFSSEQLVNGVYRGVIGATDKKGKVTIRVEGTAAAGMKSFKIIRKYLNDAGPQTTVAADFDVENQTEFIRDFVYTVQVSDLQAETELEAVLVDNRDREVTVDLAQVEAYWPLDLNVGIILDSDTDPGVKDYNHYLVIQNVGTDPNGLPKIDVQPSSISGLAAGSYSKIQFLFDYDITLKGGTPVGSYLCSPFHAQTSNPDLVDYPAAKNHTILKAITYSSLTSAENAQLQSIDENDVAFLMALFDKYQPGATLERVTFNGAQGDTVFVLFKTSEGKIGLIKDYEINEGVEASISFDVWVML